jgi:hypothetical protein
MKDIINKSMLGLAVSFLFVTAQAAEVGEAVGKGRGSFDAKTETFDLVFSGGPPAKLVEAMEKARGQKLNVLLPPNLSGSAIPRMELRSVTVATVFTSLNQILVRDENMRWFQVDNVWILQSGSETRNSQVFYVGHLLSKFKVEDITTAIQTTWKLAGKDSKAELKYHEDTQLLIALANKSQLETVTEVLRELQRAFPDKGHQSTLLSVP